MGSRILPHPVHFVEHADAVGERFRAFRDDDGEPPAGWPAPLVVVACVGIAAQEDPPPHPPGEERRELRGRRKASG